MPKANLFLETTTVTATKSIGEILSLLGRTPGVKQIATDYREGRVTGLNFVIALRGEDAVFKLPARITPVLEKLKKAKPFSRRRGSPEQYAKALQEQAERIAWRQLFRWLQAQIALIDLSMVKPEEVFLPYVTFDFVTGETLFERFEQRGLKMLAAGDKQ